MIALSEAWFWVHLLLGIASTIPRRWHGYFCLTRFMFIQVDFSVMADHSSRGLLTIVLRLSVISRNSEKRKLRPARVVPPKKIDSAYYYSELVNDTASKCHGWPSLVAILIHQIYFQVMCLKREKIMKIYPHRD